MTKPPPSPSSASCTFMMPTITFSTTEWVPDDRDTWNPQTATVTKKRSHITLMSKIEQKAILKAYGCAFFRAVLHATGGIGWSPDAQILGRVGDSSRGDAL